MTKSVNRRMQHRIPISIQYKSVMNNIRELIRLRHRDFPLNTAVITNTYAEVSHHYIVINVTCTFETFISSVSLFYCNHLIRL